MSFHWGRWLGRWLWRKGWWGFRSRFNDQKKVWGIAYLQQKVLVKLDKPLFPGFYLCCPRKNDSWIQYRYERISEWCIECGIWIIQPIFANPLLKLLGIWLKFFNSCVWRRWTANIIIQHPRILQQGTLKTVRRLLLHKVASHRSRQLHLTGIFLSQSPRLIHALSWHWGPHILPYQVPLLWRQGPRLI